ncbi:uncharacterized protein [Watersipora subatra]|uniref:uncharacterized protein n=1 Tax=Watersipora subatra TaxID=2589382 RepID=UPI00355B9318
MGSSESAIPRRHESNSKVLDISRHVSHKAFVKHSRGEINYNCLTEIPWDLRDSTTMYEKIDASFNHISDIPEEVPLRIPHLTQLILSYNKISSLPETFALFFHLQELRLDHNELDAVPISVTKLVTLEKLDLSDNLIKELPEEIGEMNSLARLNLCNNRLRQLPVELAQCPLQVILVQNNRLQKPSQEVCDLGSWKTIEALRSMSSGLPTQQVTYTLEFPRILSPHLLMSSHNASVRNLEYSQLQIFPDKVKTPLIPPIGSSTLVAADLRDRIVGLIYGAAIGDALALATEQLSVDECLFHYKPLTLCYDDIIRDEHRTHWKKGDWTTAFDQMALVMDGIIQWAGVVDELEFAKRLLAWRYSGFPELGDKHGFCLSKSTDEIMCDSEFTTDPHRVAASQDSEVEDDVALVRALITGIPHFHDLEEVMANSVRLCKVTHSSSTCVTASAFLSGIVALLLQGTNCQPDHLAKEAFIAAQQYLPNEESRNKFAAIFENPAKGMEEKEGCMKALRVALQSLRWGRDFRLTMMKVVMAGGDCKAAATITGAVHGGLTGYSHLPRDYVLQLLPQQTDWLNVKINHLLDLMAIP